jgi:two-component system chemotaxis sensor kinase CheA
VKGFTLPPQIIARFRSLSIERLEKLEAAWATLSRGEGNPEIEASARQELHTLKGDAKVTGFPEVNRLCHKLEELFAAAERMSYRVPEDFDLVVTMAIRFVAMLVRKKDGAALAGIDVDGFALQIDDVLAEASVLSAPVPAPAMPAIPSAIPPSPVPPGRSTDVLDRVSTATQQRLAAAATQVFLEELQSSGPARARLHAIWRSLSAQINALYAAPLEKMLERHKEAAEELARELGKEAQVSIAVEGVWLRLDAAEAVDTTVLHAIRNAVDHGLEDPDARVAAGKSEVGEVRVTARTSGGWVELFVEDDGRGIDFEQVRRRGEAVGLLSPDSARRPSEEDLLKLLLRPGFSTRTRATDVSGRGVGLDAAKSALNRTGGTLAVSTRKGHGTRLTLRIPQATRRLTTTCFRARGTDILLAVDESWRVTTARTEEDLGLDPLDALDVSPPGRPEPAALERGVVLIFQRGPQTVVLRAEGPPGTCEVERLCPTGEEHPVEVVLLHEGPAADARSAEAGSMDWEKNKDHPRGREALLVRPERLLMARPAGGTRC